MKRMILVKKYSYQMTSSNCYYANVCVDPSGQYLQIQNVEYVKGMGLLETVTNKSKLFQYKLNDITGFMYGACSTRFQMFKNSINEIIAQSDDIKNIDSLMPFYAWECLTIQFKRRDLDIVVKDEQQMEILLKFLIMETNSFDSNRNSLDFLKHTGFIRKHLKSRLLMNQIFKGYRMMKQRMKICFQMAIT